MDGSRCPVLVVSGDPALRALVSDTLTPQGYAVAAGDYAGALDALDALGLRPPALVLLDLHGQE